MDHVSGVGPGNAARFSQGGLTVNNVAYNAPAAAAANDKARSGKAVDAAPAKAAAPR